MGFLLSCLQALWVNESEAAVFPTQFFLSVQGFEAYAGALRSDSC